MAMVTDGAEREYVWRGATGPFTIRLAPGVFMPSTTTRVVGDALRVADGATVIDAGCGSGILSFVAARLGAGRVIGCDVSEAAVRCATDNARRLGLSDVTEFRVGDLLEPVRDVRADLIIADVSGIPDAIAEVTGWFPDGRGGGPTGSELPIAMISGMERCLAPGGEVYLPTGSIQEERQVIAAARAIFGDRMDAVAERMFPLPDVVATSPAVARLISDGVVELFRRGSRLLWRLTVWHCRQAPDRG